MNPKTHTRQSAILLPLFSLPNSHGIGSLGNEAYRWVDFLEQSKVRIWQLLPLTVTSYGDSPYQSPSVVGLNPYFIALEELVKQGLLTVSEANSETKTNPQRIDYGALFRERIPLLKKAFSRFSRDNEAFLTFQNEGTYHDFATFMTLKEQHGFAAWNDWGNERIYRPEEAQKFIHDHQETYQFYLWTQFEFLREFRALKQYANQKGVLLMGDMPLYVARDSLEAYMHPELFLMDEKRNPVLVAGCPPDAFTSDGQLWGNPIYDWAAQKKTGYRWWKERIQYNLSLYDILRIDHFRGISAYYTIPYGEKTARNGKWLPGPGFDLFEGETNLPIVAEDLGYMDEKVKTLLKKTTFPGMKVLQFAFGPQSEMENLPSLSPENSVCYTGTHDNEPLLSLYASYDTKDQENFHERLAKECAHFALPIPKQNAKDIVRSSVELCYASPSNIAILPLWDLLAKGHEARINTPSLLSSDNWTYRYQKEDFTDELSAWIRKEVESTNRQGEEKK